MSARDLARLSGSPLPRSRRAAPRGFTLLECALATVIIGVGVLALVEAQGAFNRANDFSTSAATATYLANEVRERIRALPRHDSVTGLYFADAGRTDLRGWGPEPGELTAEDFDDIDDYDGVVFGAGGTQAGPIDSTARVIPEVDPQGAEVVDADGNGIAMRGWSQQVIVEKVDPFNFSTVRADNFFRAAVPPNVPELAVDAFPLRVTVVVSYQGPLDAQPAEMARVVWIAP